MELTLIILTMPVAPVFLQEQYHQLNPELQIYVAVRLHIPGTLLINAEIPLIMFKI